MRGSRLFPRRRHRVPAWARRLMAWNREDSHRVGDRVHAAVPGLEVFDRDPGEIVVPTKCVAYIDKHGDYVYIDGEDAARDRAYRDIHSEP